MKPFETEGLQNLDSLKKQLVNVGNIHTDVINEKFNKVIKDWNEDNVVKGDRALKLHDLFGQIEDLYLMFAKKASAFHSLFVGHALCLRYMGNKLWTNLRTKWYKCSSISYKWPYILQQEVS